MRILEPVKAYPTRMTPSEELGSLIRSLYPRLTNGPLIRLGPSRDGGYLVPDALEGIEACFSPGVSDQSGFELACAHRQMRVFLADRTVNGPSIDHRLFNFQKVHIGATNIEGFITLESWIEGSKLEPNSDLMMQMDIEGAEYEALLAIPDRLLKRFRILIIEFHQLDALWSRPFFGIARRVFDKLLCYHRCVHIHPNNCCVSMSSRRFDIPSVMEFTFARNDLVGFEFCTAYPHPLDSDNTNNPPIVLPACWHAQQRTYNSTSECT